MAELAVINDKYSPTKEDYAGMSTGSLNNMLEVRAVANFLSKSKFIPPSLRGDLNTAVVLCITCQQMGLPITALTEVMEVNGKVSFWGRTKLAIVLKSPICEYIMPEETSDTKCVLVAKRKTWPKEVKETFTIEMAKKAGLLDRSDAWKKHPADMLYWKAVSRVISKVFPDVIQGFGTVEDEEDGLNTLKPQAVAQPKAVEAPKVEIIAKSVEPADISDLEEVKEEVITPQVLEEVFTDVEPKVPQAVEKGSNSRLWRIIKRVALVGGVRFCTGINPLTNEEEKFNIPSAELASALKKLTGSKVEIIVENGEIIDFKSSEEGENA